MYDQALNLSDNAFEVPMPLHVSSKNSSNSPSNYTCSDGSGSHASDGESDHSSKYSSSYDSSCDSQSDFSSSVEAPRFCAGGVLTTVRRSCFTSDAVFSTKVWVPGRVLEILL